MPSRTQFLAGFWSSLVGLFLFFTPLSLPASDIPKLLLAPDIDCGTILLGGLLLVKSDGLTVLKVYPGTTQEYDLVVLGFPLPSLMKLQDLPISLEAKVFRTKREDYPRLQFIRFQAILTETESHSFPVQQLARESCRGANP